MRVRVGVVVALSALLLAPASATAAKKRPQAKRVAKVRLAAFDSCTELVGWGRDQALRTGGGVGVPIRALPPAAVGLAPRTPVAEVRANGVATPTLATPAPAADD